MTEAELLRGVLWMTDRYGDDRRWNNTRVLLEDFGAYTAGAFMEAMHAYYATGADRGPAPARILAMTGAAQQRRFQDGTDPAPPPPCPERGHVWALPSPTDLALAREHPDTMGVLALEECAVCHETQPHRQRGRKVDPRSYAPPGPPAVEPPLAFDD